MQIFRTPPSKTLLTFCLLLPFVVLSACRGTPTVSFNDNVVYSENTALLNQLVQDSSLQGCINQLLKGTLDQDPKNIRILACTDAEIRSLAGISALSNLEQLELSNNLIDNLAPLQPLLNLRVLSIRNNRLENIGPLEGMSVLRFLVLDGNNGIPCRQLDQWQKKLGNTLSRPEQCKK